MPEIIPAINVETFEELKKQIQAVEPYTNWIHIDVADGTFTPNSIWHNFSDLNGLETSLNIEVHLMISDIDTRFTDWLLPNVGRLIFHLEAGHDPFDSTQAIRGSEEPSGSRRGRPEPGRMDDPLFVVQKIKEAKKEVLIGILPETPWEKTKPFWVKADGILLLSVSPGFAGQQMNENTFEKIRALHTACPHCIIEVDGGVYAGNARELVRAGAGRLVAASAIFGQTDIKKAIDELKFAVSR